MPITAASANGVIDSYTASLGGIQALTVYGVSNGSGGLSAGPRIGIGTTTPAATLTVAGSICAAMTSGGTGLCGTPVAGGIYSDTSSVTGNNFDVAEAYPTSDPTLSAGEVAAFDPSASTTVMRATSNSSTYLGVVSTAPAIEIGLLGASSRPIALAGRVPVKVSLQNGPIIIGDRLTISSTPGVAMKATASGPTIGVAIDSYSATSTSSTVMAFIDPQYYFAPADFSIAPGGFIGIGTTTPGDKLTVSGSAYASAFEGPVDSESFLIGTTSVIAQVPAAVLTAAGNVNLIKLATFTLADVQSLAAAVASDETRLTSLETRVTALESGAVSSGSGTPLFSRPRPSSPRSRGSARSYKTASRSSAPWSPTSSSRRPTPPARALRAPSPSSRATRWRK